MPKVKKGLIKDSMSDKGQRVSFVEPKKGDMANWHKQTCNVCGRAFWSRNPMAGICSDRCYKIMVNYSGIRMRHANNPKTDIPERVCLICGKTFKPLSRKNRLCSKECYYKYYTKQVIDEKVLCPICGKEFNKTKFYQKCCSEKCKLELRRQIAANRRPRNEVRVINCDNCGKEVRSSHPATRFCSIECKDEFYKAKYHKEKNLWQSQYTRKCKNCHQQFSANRSNQVFCSKKCRIAHASKQAKNSKRSRIESEKKNDELVACMMCHKEFKPYRNRKRYCSQECYLEHVKILNKEAYKKRRELIKTNNSGERVTNWSK